MESSVLEFKLYDSLFCLNTECVDYVFELEGYSVLDILDDTVLGLARYNDDVMVLIDTSKLYGNDYLNMATPKSVIVVQSDSGAQYGLVVDEIVKIEDVEPAVSGAPFNTETTINHYKAKDIIINEIDPFALLRNKHIPGLGKVYSRQDQNAVSEMSIQKKDYLLFLIGEKHYALETMYVREVLENDMQKFPLELPSKHYSGAIAVREETIKIAAIDNTENANDVIIVENTYNSYAIEVDTILDIESFDEKLFEPIDDVSVPINSFYNHKGSVVAILDPLYFTDSIEEESFSDEGIMDESKKISFLMFHIANRHFCIEMEHVRYVAETDTLTKTQSSSVIAGNTTFITTWNHHAVNVISLENTLHLKADTNNTQTIFTETDGRYMAFIVDEIDDIIAVEAENVSMSVDPDVSVIKGAIIQNNQAIAILNNRKLFTIGRK